jgi:predicted dehydrogenase
VEAEEMAAVARATQLPAIVNFTYRSLPGQRFVAQLLASGVVGYLHHLDLTYWQARQALPGALPTDALMDVVSHQVDLALWWGGVGGTGDVTLLASLEERRDRGNVPIFAALARTTAGAIVSFQADRVAAGWRNGMVCRIVGDTGTVTLTFDTEVAEVDVARFGDGRPEGTARRLAIPPDLAVSYPDFPAFHVDRLVGALSGEIEFPDFDHGLRCQRLLAAMRRSVDEARWIRQGPDG